MPDSLAIALASSVLPDRERDARVRARRKNRLVTDHIRVDQPRAHRVIEQIQNARTKLDDEWRPTNNRIKRFSHQTEDLPY